MSAEALLILKSIDASLKELVAFARARRTASIVPDVASDRDLDGKFGNPELKFSPRDWTGPSFKGLPFSECPPELLDLVAETFDYFARQADEKGEKTDAGKPISDYKRKDAARARGWAQRMRNGTHVRPATEDHGEDWAGDGAEGWN